MSDPTLGPLVPADETFNHQITDTFATVSQSDRSWTEKVCAMACARDGALQLGFGIGKYPNRDVIDAYAGATGGHDAGLDMGEGLGAAGNPIRTLHGFGGERPAVRDMAVYVDTQLGNGRRDSWLRVPIEVRSHRRFERIGRESNRALVGRARRLHVFRYGAIVRNQLLDDGARTTCQRLVSVLHLADRIDGSASGLGRNRVTHENDDCHGREAEKQPTADTELQRTTNATCSRRHGVIWHKT